MIQKTTTKSVLLHLLAEARGGHPLCIFYRQWNLNWSVNKIDCFKESTSHWFMVKIGCSVIQLFSLSAREETPSQKDTIRTIFLIRDQETLVLSML